MKMFSQRLKELRKEKNMTQTQLATLLGVSKGTVAMWEVGQREPKFEMLKVIASIFGKTTDYILDYKNEVLGRCIDDQTENLAKYIDKITHLKINIVDYLCLDEYGKNAVECLIQAEKERCSKYGSFLAKEDLTRLFEIKE